MISTVGLISFGAWIGNKVADKGFESIYENLIRIDKENKFYQIVDETAKEIQKTYPDVLGGSIEHFFKREEVFNELLKILFVDSKVDFEIINAQFDKKTLPNNFVVDFVSLLRQKLLLDKTFSTILSNKELYIAFLGVNSSLESLNKVSNLSHEEIRKIREILEKRFNSNFNIQEFKQQLFENSLNILSQVNFIGLGIDSSIRKGKRKNINELFVKPTFSISDEMLKTVTTKNKKDEIINDQESIKLSELFNLGKKIVILGNPGSGKSFLIKFLICSIIRGEESILLDNNFFSFRIELRKYLAYKKENNGNILDYLPVLMGTEFGLYNLPQNLFDELFESENAIIFFDGLDEIFNVQDRLNVKNDIESFHNVFKKTYCIVTSRIIGYDETSFNPGEYVEVHINDFDNARNYSAKLKI